MGSWFSDTSEPRQETLLEIPWRNIYDNTDFLKTAVYLKQTIRTNDEARLNILMIGPTGAGKSSLINSIFSISRGRIVNKVTTKGDDIGGIGTYHFIGLKSRASDLFRNVYIFDTMGFTSLTGNDDKGIKDSDLRAVCEGRVTCGHKFNEDTASGEETENRPHCVIFVVGAEEMDWFRLFYDSVLKKKLESLNTFVPPDVARLAIVTKMDRVCADTNKDTKNIYRSRKVQSLVKKASRTFGVNENEVFPIVNFVKEMEVDDVKSVPILYALKFVLERGREPPGMVVYRRLKAYLK